jgi:hypothetical protein
MHTHACCAGFDTRQRSDATAHHAHLLGCGVRYFACTGGTLDWSTCILCFVLSFTARPWSTPGDHRESMRAHCCAVRPNREWGGRLGVGPHVAVTVSTVTVTVTANQTSNSISSHAIAFGFAGNRSLLCGTGSLARAAIEKPPPLLWAVCDGHTHSTPRAAGPASGWCAVGDVRNSLASALGLLPLARVADAVRASESR